MRTIVGDDAIRHPKPAHEALDELDYRTSWDGADSFHFHPLGELVNGDVEVAIAPWRPGKRAQNVQPPKCEWPREWNGLQALSWLMNLLGMELTGFTSLHQLDCIIEHCWPIEPAAKRLADQGP